MAEVQTKRSVTVESVNAKPASDDIITAKLVKSQTSSVDIRTPNEKTLDPLVMEIIRGELGNKETNRDDLLNYLRQSNAESDYMNVTRMLNRDGSLTEAERIVHSVYGYEIAKETLEGLGDGSSADQSMDSLKETLDAGFNQVSSGAVEMKSAIDSGLLNIKEGLNGGFQKTEEASKELCNRIENGFKTLNESMARMQDAMVMTTGKVSESSEGIRRSLKQLTETIEKSTSALTQTLEEGINRLIHGVLIDPTDESKPSHKKK
jgi:Arc/MetJ-type ribon-helix-helix transcriptional regulator